MLANCNQYFDIDSILSSFLRMIQENYISGSGTNFCDLFLARALSIAVKNRNSRNRVVLINDQIKKRTKRLICSFVCILFNQLIIQFKQTTHLSFQFNRANRVWRLLEPVVLQFLKKGLSR